MPRPPGWAYVARSQGGIHSPLRPLDVVLVRELLLSPAVLLLLQFQLLLLLALREILLLLIPELLLLLQLQLPLLLLVLRELLLLLLKELLLLLLLELLLLQELLPTYSFEFVPWRERSLLGEITQGVCIPQ